MFNGSHKNWYVSKEKLNNSEFGIRINENLYREINDRLRFIGVPVKVDFDSFRAEGKYEKESYLVNGTIVCLYKLREEFIELFKCCVRHSYPSKCLGIIAEDEHRLEMSAKDLILPLEELVEDSSK